MAWRGAWAQEGSKGVHGQDSPKWGSPEQGHLCVGWGVSVMGGWLCVGLGGSRLWGPVSGHSCGDHGGERWVCEPELEASVWTRGFEHTQLWNRVQTWARVRGGSHLRPLVCHRAPAPQQGACSAPRSACWLQLLLGSQGPWGEGGCRAGQGAPQAHFLYLVGQNAGRCSE